MHGRPWELLWVGMGFLNEPVWHQSLQISDCDMIQTDSKCGDFVTDRSYVTPATSYALDKRIACVLRHLDWRA